MLIPLTAPYALKNSQLELAPYVEDVASALWDDYTAAVSSVLFTPNAPTATWLGIGGNSVSDIAAPTWTSAIGYAQDLAADGLSRYLHEHHGETRWARFTPITADGEPGADVQIVALVRLAAGNIGGTAGPNTATATATLGVIDAPAFVDPTP